MDVIDRIVFIVDDDSGIREALRNLMSSVGLHTMLFDSALKFFEAHKPDVPACLLLDLELPGINGLNFQRQIAAEYHPPIVFLTGFGDIQSSVRAIKAGAIDFLTKPFCPLVLLEAVNTGILQDESNRLIRRELSCLKTRHLTLTPREQEVLPLVVSGLLNKQAASQLGISEVTLQVHRSKVMQKMKADSLPDLVRMASALGIPLTRSRGTRGG
jgi:FixJ family two-component response regulator